MRPCGVLSHGSPRRSWLGEDRGSGEIVGPRDSLSLAFLGWVFGCTFVYSALFGTGAFLYGQPLQGTVCLAVAVGAGLGLFWVMPKIWRGDGSTAAE